MRDEQLSQPLIPPEMYGSTDPRDTGAITQVNVPAGRGRVHITVDVDDDRDREQWGSARGSSGSPKLRGSPDRRASPVGSSRGSKKKKNDKDSKDMGRVRDAFERGDVDASRAEHRKRAPEKHNPAFSEYVKSIIFGGLDGIITTFAIVAAAAGAEENWKVVLIFGFANVAADAWSMGSGEFISAIAEQDRAKAERKREEWEVEHDRSGEIAEMIEIYQEKGFSKEDATELVRIISKDDKIFVDKMMVDELGIICDESETWKEPFKQGVFMFFSFVFFGLFPLAAYFGGKGKGLDWVFGLSCGLAGLGMMILGGAKGYLTRQSIPKTAIKMLASGTVSGGLSYGLGVLVSYAVTGDPNAASG